MIQTSSLPIDALLPEIVAAVGANPCVVLQAAPGAGKTTRVPPALLAHVRGEVLVLEPRRIAARMAARQVAAEMGEDVGQTVGYSVRFEQVGGPATRLRFVTEGVLTRRFTSDPELKGVALVVLDEFHERHLDTDLALALLRRLQRTTRRDLKLLVMSATLDAAPIAAYLGGCPVLVSEGRMFPLDVEFRPYTAEALHVQVANAVGDVERRGSGDTLVFLPGSAEIRRAQSACADVAQRVGMDVLPLHGDLSAAEQDRAVMRGPRRKVILATNVAESSITIDGVDAVIDSGLARIATTSPWTGLATLNVGRVSQASLRQRAGRAGRTGPGMVVRLFPEEDFRQRPAHDVPEILRSNLGQLVLTLRVLGMDASELKWLDAPPAAALDAATALLDRLGAAGKRAAELARFPLPPRLARVLVEGVARGVAYQACVAVALLSVRGATGNLLSSVDRPPENAMFRRTLEQMLRMTRASRATSHEDEALLKALMYGFPDRVARVRSGRQLMVSAGFAAELAEDAPGVEFLVALDAEDRTEKALPQVRTFVPIEAEWLIDLFPERVREAQEMDWNRAAERVDEVDTMLYDELVLSQSRGGPRDREGAARFLAERAMEAGLARFVDAAALENLQARILFAGLEGADAAAVLRELCVGLRSFAELEDVAGGSLLAMMEQAAGARLKQLAPATIALRGGRVCRVNYEAGKPPWIASRLQDFFGMEDSPRIGPERTAVVVHLLAPNQRAVQTTSDLRGFWERLYPTVRRELMRRYPRHQWPENPK